MIYVFMSFADTHTRQNIGCCIVQVDHLKDANEKCKQLGLMPQICNEARGFPLNEQEFQQQGMELNRLYSRHEMEQMGFEKARSLDDHINRPTQRP